ncbi:MAG TPA: SRPBCC domain-containing protein [Caulobacteraceae bacterium]|nr:SRPBCC domain-containing protein [Caulobacteraceae bacterium]
MSQTELCRFPDRFTVEYVRTFPHPIERVWRAITDPAEFGMWFMPGTIEPKAGGAFGFAGGQWTGSILAFEPPRLIRLRNAGDAVGYFQYELSEAAGGTRMRFVQHFSPDGVYGEPGSTAPGAGTPWRGAVNGWHEFWEALGDHLDGVPPGSRLPATRLSGIAELWAEKIAESGLALTPDQLSRIVLGLRRRERSTDLFDLYDDHLRTALPPAGSH